MLVHELITELLKLQAEGHGNTEIVDTNGWPIIAVSGPDLDLPAYDQSRDKCHIEGEF